MAADSIEILPVAPHRKPDQSSNNKGGHMREQTCVCKAPTMIASCRWCLLKQALRFDLVNIFMTESIVLARGKYRELLKAEHVAAPRTRQGRNVRS